MMAKGGTFGLVVMATALLAVQCHAKPEHFGSAEEDRITSLPGLVEQPPFGQFSGYLQADDHSYFHYWFVESQSNPTEDPLLLWLNGGPGCSSMDGLLNELGPFTLNANGSVLTANPHSWNTFANVLFLESPSCVGFSYNDKGDCSASDDTTSRRNLNALRHFFAKFPGLKKNEFFVTGESYAGIYVPTLTERIVQENGEGAVEKINIKGYAVGNGLSSWAMNTDSIMFFAYFHGLLGQRYWDSMIEHCCDGGLATRDSCNFFNNDNLVCNAHVQRASKIIFDSGLNMYNLYADCVHPEGMLGASHSFSRYHADRRNLFRHTNRLFRGVQSRVGLDPPCTDSSAMSHFLNSEEVKAAIHVHSDIEWAVCNDEVNQNYKQNYHDMKKQHEYLLSQGMRALVYNGDVDMACNFLGDQWFVESMNLKDVEARRMWHTGGQVAGFVKRFEGLDFLTVRGSGHMVPQDKPAEALHMIKAFVADIPY